MNFFIKSFNSKKIGIKSVSESEQCFIVNKLINYNETKYEMTTDLIIKDLEIFENKSPNNKSLFNILNKTITKFGNKYLENIIKNPTSDISFLNYRQNIIKNLSNKLLFKKIKNNLDNIKLFECDFLWLYKELDDETNKLFESVYFKNSFLKKLNQYEYILSLYYYYRLIFAPCMGIISPITFLLIPYIIVKKLYNINISFNFYFSLLKFGLYNINNFTNNSLNSKISFFCSLMFYILIYIHNLYINIESALNINNIINIIHNKINNIAKFLKESFKLNNYTCYLFNENKLSNFIPELENNIFFQEPNILSNKGLILTTFNKIRAYKNKYKSIINYLGKIDAYLAIASLVNNSESNKSKFCYSRFLKLNKPIIICKKLWHPYLNPNKVIHNNIDLGIKKYNNILITGPNASGKSTILKALSLSVLFSQTLTISSSKYMIFTPFSIINTYLNIPDCPGKDSLFEAEMRRALNHIKQVEYINKNQFSFVVMDEILSSTNPEEGISGAYAIAKYLGKFINSISIITTHFNYLSKLEKKTKNFINYKMPVKKNKNKIIYLYKIKKGISDQFIALDILQQKGFNTNIINDAKKISRKISNDIYISKV